MTRRFSVAGIAESCSRRFIDIQPINAEADGGFREFGEIERLADETVDPFS